MKKIFSAFLLMTMMVFSVGSFVSCSDIEENIAALDKQTTQNAADIADLNSKVAALQTALNAAQADADAAMAAAKAAAADAKAAQATGDAAAAAAAKAQAEAEAAKAAAAQAKADAIADTAAKLEAIQTAIAQNVEAITNLSGSVNANAVEIEALQGEVKDLQTAASQLVYAITNLNGSVENHEAAIEDLQTEVSVMATTLENYEAILAELGLLTETMEADIEAMKTEIAQLVYAVTNINATVENHDAAIQDLLPKFDAVVADVKAINESLVVVKDILSALANQIQSVVFVPEYDTDVVYANGYNVVGVASNYVATATYEVRPAKLAESLTSENLSFASVDLKATKAAAPEYYKAQLVSADPATGRIVVRAIINDQTSKSNKTSDHKVLANGGTLALSLNIASVDVTELLIAESEAANVDVVSSAYVQVKKNAAANMTIGFPKQTATAKSTTSTYTKNTNMPWNTPVEESKVNLFDSVPCVLLGVGSGEEFVGEEFLTFEQASELLGLDFAVKYHTAADTKFKASYAKNGTAIPSNKKAPAQVTGTTLEATAELVASNDYKNDNSVGVVATLTGSLDVVLGEKELKVVTLGATGTYTITNKLSDFSFADAKEVAWSYADADYARAIKQELAVVGFDKMDKNSAPWTFTAKVGDNTATATVKALSTKAVEVSIPAGQLPYKQGEKAVYEFKGTITYSKVDYEVAFNVTLGAMPVDQVIDLGVINTVGKTKSDMVIDGINPIFQARKAINDVDNNFNKNVTDADVLTSYFKTRSEAEVAENDGVIFNGEELKSASAKGYAKFNLAAGVDEDDEDVLVDASTIVVNAVADYENTVVVTETYTVCGVDFTFTAKVVTEKPVLSFGPAVAYVTPDYKVNLDGTVKFEYADAKNTATKASTKYVLNKIDLSDYVDVTVPEDLENDVVVRYTLKSNPYVKEYNEDGTIKSWKEGHGTTSLPKMNDKYVLDPCYVAAGAPVVLNWRTDMREMVYEFALVSTTKLEDENGKPVDNVLKSFEATLVVPELVKTFSADKEIKVKYENGKTATANIAGAFTIVDKFDNVIHNAYAPTLTYIWDGYKLDANGKLAQIQDAGFYNAYEQAIVLPAAKDVKAYIGTTDVTSQVNPTLAADGTVTIKPETATLTGDVVVKVPVKLTYIYDEHGAQAKTAEVSVVFSLTEGEVETPGAVAFETPAGQWIGTFGDMKLLFDFGTATYKFDNNITKTNVLGAFLVMNPQTEKYVYDQTVSYVADYTFSDVTISSGVVKVNPYYFDADEDGKTIMVKAEYGYESYYTDYTGTSFTYQSEYGPIQMTKVADADVQATIETLSYSAE